MARKNRYDAPRRSALGKPPADDATEVTIRSGRGLLPVDDETNFGDSARSSELEAELLKIDPRKLAAKLASTADHHDTTVRKALPRRTLAELPEDQPTTVGPALSALAEDDNSLGAPMPIEDPAGLARRLASQAKARLNKTPKQRPAEKNVRTDRPAPRRMLSAGQRGRTRNQAPPAKSAAPPARQSKPAARQPTPAPRQPAPPETKSRPAPKQPAAARKPAPKVVQQAPPVESRKPQAPTPRPAPPRRPRKVSQAPPAPKPPRSAPKPPVEDPAAMARRLAKEAKARLGAAASAPPPAKEPTPPPNRPVAASAPPPAPESASSAGPAPSPTRSKLADRAPRTPRKLTAAEAVKKFSAEPAPERMKRPTGMIPPPAAEATPLHSAVSALAELLPGVIIETQQVVSQTNVFKALWEAHQARAIRSGRLPLAATATVLLNHVQSGHTLVAAKVRHSNQQWAVFMDGSTFALLAIVDMPEIYLAGVK